jgi:hypothetical protein
LRVSQVLYEDPNRLLGKAKVWDKDGDDYAGNDIKFDFYV